MHDNVLLTTQQAAAILNISCDGVKKGISRGTYKAIHISGKGQGGKQLRILLDSLPEEVQARYNGIEPEKPASDFDIKRLTEKQRTKLEHKIFVVKAYESFRKEYLKRDYRKAFIEYFKSEYPEIDAELKLNAGKLEDWVKKYKENGAAGLTDGRGGSGKGTTSLSEDMQNDFLSLYLTDKKPPITTCYNVLKIYYDDQGIKIPHLSSFKRFASSIPPSVISLYREGKKHFSDNHIASIPTVYERNMKSNDEWVADHHIYDVMVNGSGKIARAWLSIWFDRHSRAVVGYVINLCEPNADIVLDSFIDAVTKNGVPKRVHIDNGKDYKASVVSSSKSRLTLELAAAYPEEAAVSSWQRTVSLRKNEVSITDRYRLQAYKAPTRLMLMTTVRPDVSRPGIVVRAPVPAYFSGSSA